MLILCGPGQGSHLLRASISFTIKCGGGQDPVGGFSESWQPWEDSLNWAWGCEELRLELEGWLWGFPLSQGAVRPPTPRTDPAPTPARPPIQASLRVIARCCGSGRRCRTRSSTMAV